MDKKLLVLVAATLVAAPMLANAALVSYRWSGSILNSGTLSDVSVGDTIKGSFTYDTNTPGEIQPYWPSETWVLYRGAVKSATFSFGDYFGSYADLDMAVFNDITNFGDQFDVRVYDDLVPPSYSGSLPNGWHPWQLFIPFNDSTGAALIDNSLPFRIPDGMSNSFNTARIDGWNVEFNVVAFSRVPVPEPSTITLFCLGLAGVALLRRQSRDAA